MHPAEPHGLRVEAVGFIELYRDVRLHPQHIRHLHRATQIDNVVGCVRLNCATCGRIHSVPSPSVTEQRTIPRVVKSWSSWARNEWLARSICSALGVDRTPFDGKRDSFRQTIEQAEAESFFQALHPAGDRRRAGAHAIAALRKLSVRATTTKTRRSSHERRSSSTGPMGRSVFAASRSDNFSTAPRLPVLRYFPEANSLRNLHNVHGLSGLSRLPVLSVCAATTWVTGGED